MWSSLLALALSIIFTFVVSFVLVPLVFRHLAGVHRKNTQRSA